MPLDCSAKGRQHVHEFTCVAFLVGDGKHPPIEAGNFASMEDEAEQLPNHLLDSKLR